MKFLGKKGQLGIGNLLPIGITFVVLAIALGLGATVLDSVQDGQTAGSYASNITTDGLSSVEEVSSWMPTIALVVVAVVIIGLVMLFMRNR